VIICPSAALSMRRIRIYQAPLNKGIAELLQMLDRGIRVRLGTDNVDDMFLPATTMDLRNEVGCLGNTLRFYHAGILAKIACGSILNDKDKKIIRDFLDDEESFLEHFSL
jgi:cytosine deaminase